MSDLIRPDRPDRGAARYDDPEDVAPDVIRGLQAYAAANLEPDPGAAGRTRKAIMTAAVARSAAVAPTAGPPPIRAVAARRGRLRPGLFPWLRRRPVLALVGAGALLVAATGTTLAASTAGGPLYPVRLWAETLTLPTDPMARTNAELARLRSRLDETTAALGRADAGAAAAALDAYRAELADARAAAGSDPARLTAVAVELSRQRQQVEALERTATPAGNVAVRASLQQTTEGIDRALADPPAGAAPGASAAATTPSAGTPGASQGGHAAGPPATPGRGRPPESSPSASPSPSPGVPRGPSPGTTQGPTPSPTQGASPSPTPRRTAAPGSGSGSPAAGAASPRPTAHPTHKPHSTPHPRPKPKPTRSPRS
jgi:hypothetical protein